MALLVISTTLSVVHAQDSEFGIDEIITGATRGSDTGFPLPRFVSIKSARVNMRVGPSYDHPVAWIYVRRGLPVEIIQEFDAWRQVRDSDGQVGWIHKALLQGKRNVLVAPWRQGDYFSLFDEPSTTSKVVARLQAGVQTGIGKCQPDWCFIRGHGYRGWIARSDLWGVYPTESIE